MVCSRWWGDQVAKYRRSKYAINLQKIEPDFKRFIAYLKWSVFRCGGKLKYAAKYALLT